MKRKIKANKKRKPNKGNSVKTKKRKMIIAIDGIAGSGKSTLGHALAEKLKYRYVDTGAMYRMLTYLAIKKDLKTKKDIIKLAKKTKISLKSLKTKKIRLPEVSDMVSQVAAIKDVRKEMVKQQRQLAEKGGAVVEGRDIGTVVFPDADIKFFVIANVAQRAKRRFIELKDKGIKVAKDAVSKNIKSRDKRDTSRKASPLKPAKDAIVITLQV